MSGKTRGGTPRKHPGIKGRRPDIKQRRREEAVARALHRSNLIAKLKLGPKDPRQDWSTLQLEFEVGK